MRYARTTSAAALVSALIASSPQDARAVEVTVQNDSITDGSTATICPCFVAGEQAAVWLTSPCDGNIVAIQVFWRSALANQSDVIEDSITVRNPGTYPVPGTVLETLEAPVLTDGVTNEYRFLDENQTIPISVPVTNGQEFVVAFEFFNDNVGTNGPSLVFDTGLTPNKNAVFAQGLGWVPNSLLGVNGDWFIRVVIDCAAVTTGACCVGGGCIEDLTSSECSVASGVFLGLGTDCAGDPCSALPGACCFPPSGCLSLTEADCTVASGNWQGPGTTCPDDCASPCAGDLDGDGDTDVFDFGIFAANFGQSVTPGTNGDLDNDGDVDVFDFALFGPDFGCTP